MDNNWCEPTSNIPTALAVVENERAHTAAARLATLLAGLEDISRRA